MPQSPLSSLWDHCDRASPCLQVQIYEVEEHKIETWRGKKQGAMAVAGLGMSHRAWRWAEGAGG